jgi:radical SAM superfamily enzyme YgiQ (UPF0313 family)
MYKQVKHKRRSIEECSRIIAEEARHYPEARRIFLADGDVMSRPFDELLELLEMLRDHFPLTARISVYANGSSIASKTDDELRQLRELKLHTLYMGLESGDEEILERCLKGETAEGMIDAGIKAQKAGLRASVMILLGLGGQELSEAHARATAEALNRMQPRLLSALRVVPVPNTSLQRDVADGKFHQLTEWECARETREIISRLELESTVFRANHASNVVPLEGRLPRDKERLLDELDALLSSDALDRSSPGRMPMWL